jgi:hypothetical protein
MKNKVRRIRHLVSLCLPIAFFYFLLSSGKLFSQVTTPIQNEPGNCYIKRPDFKGGKQSELKNGKVLSYQLKANELGYFNRVTNLLPEEKITIALNYPKAKAGEQLIISIEDGGDIEGKKIHIVRLNPEKSISFIFNLAADPGLYRLLIRKGGDVKVVQLWVGRED